MLSSTVGALALATFVSHVIAQECANPNSQFSNQTIEWYECPTNTEPTLQCGSINVPLDYSAPDTTEPLTLYLVRLPADGTVFSKSIIVNPGGPGSSGIRTVVEGGSSLQVIAGLGYNIVGFDPRGVGWTIPYQCPSVEYIAESSLPLTDPEGLNATYTMSVEQGALCESPEYYDNGTLIGTSYVARDIMSIVDALQEDGMIRYWGFSYGTLLGSTLAGMFPDRIDRMVLDGNINPTDYYHGLGDEAVADVDAAVEHYFETCVEAGSDVCALASDGVTAADLLQQYDNMIEGLRDGSISILSEEGYSYSYRTAKDVVIDVLKSPSRWDTSALTLLSIFQAAASPSSKRAKRQTDFDPTLLISDDVADYYWPQALYAITCSDWNDSPGDLADFEAWLQVYNDRSKYGGDSLISILYHCSQWNVNAKEKFSGEFEGIETRTPILFVNGLYDPVTPLVSAQNSSSGFIGSAVLEHTGAGHCSNAQANQCVNRKVSSYWETGVIPDDVSQVCQPDRNAWATVTSPLTDTTGQNDFNSTGFDNDDEIFRAAVNHLVTLPMDHKGPVEYPAGLHALRKRNLIKRQETSATVAATAPCTVAPTVGATSTGSAENAGGRSFAIGGTLACVIGVIGVMSLLFAS